MSYRRLYTDENGHSQVETLAANYTFQPYAPAAPDIGVAETISAKGCSFVEFPEGWTSGLHPSPRRQLFVLLAGQIEGATSTGQPIGLLPGDALLMEDTEGKGHAARVVGAGKARGLMVMLD